MMCSLINDTVCKITCVSFLPNPDLPLLPCRQPTPSLLIAYLEKCGAANGLTCKDLRKRMETREKCIVESNRRREELGGRGKLKQTVDDLGITGRLNSSTILGSTSSKRVKMSSRRSGGATPENRQN